MVRVLVFQVSLYDKASFGTITKCVDYMQVSVISSILINKFQCSQKAVKDSIVVLVLCKRRIYLNQGYGITCLFNI